MQHNRGKHVIVINEFLAKAVEQTGLASSITVLCSCGIPEIVQAGTRVVQFQNNRAETAFELMMSLKHIQEDPKILAGNQFFVEVLP
ncbi:hypothetical protein D3C81_2091300 [compost metagenome]